MTVRSYSYLKSTACFEANDPIASRDFYADLIDTFEAVGGGGGGGGGPYTVDVSVDGQATVTDTASTNSFIVSDTVAAGIAFPAAVPANGVFHLSGVGLYRHDGTSWVQV